VPRAHQRFPLGGDLHAAEPEGHDHVPGKYGSRELGGLSYEPTHGLVLVNTNRLATLVKLIPRKEYEQLMSPEALRPRGGLAPQMGTPYAMYREGLVGPSFLPCNPPPWGTLADMRLIAPGPETCKRSFARWTQSLCVSHRDLLLRVA
jgi:glucose dehydrogenase